MVSTFGSLIFSRFRGTHFVVEPRAKNSYILHIHSLFESRDIKIYKRDRKKNKSIEMGNNSFLECKENSGFAQEVVERGYRDFR